jgi:hypothetical protein
MNQVQDNLYTQMAIKGKKTGFESIQEVLKAYLQFATLLLRFTT